MDPETSFGKAHLPGYLLAAAAAVLIASTSYQPARLIASLAFLGVIVNIELHSLSRHASFDPAPILLASLLVVESLMEFAGIRRPYILLASLTVAAAVQAIAYWEYEGFREPYTPILPVAVLTAPLAGMLLHAEDPFLYTLLSVFETTIAYGIDAWGAEGSQLTLAQASAATAIYSLLYMEERLLIPVLIVATTYFIKVLASSGKLASKTYPSIDPYLKILLEGIAA